MARRFVEIITSDISGEEVDQADVCSFVWEGIPYELDVSPSDEPGELSVNKLIELARVATVAPTTKGAAKASTKAAPPTANLKTAVKEVSGKRRGRIAGAPSFSPSDYFSMFGKVQPSGRKNWVCPDCGAEIAVHNNEVNTVASTRLRQHMADNHNKLLWVTAAKRRNMAVPAGYEDRG